MYNQIIEHCAKNPDWMNLAHLSPEFIKESTSWIYNTKLAQLPDDLLIPMVCNMLMDQNNVDEYTDDFIDPGEQDDDHCVIWEEYDEDYELFG